MIGVARELGLVIREEDIEAKRTKLRKMMELSTELGTLATVAAFTCPDCQGELGPEVVGSYSHFPKSRFCPSCKKFQSI